MPWYFRGELVTVYELLQTRFGAPVKALAASLFVVMRTIADGVRLLLTAYVLAARARRASTSTTPIIALGAIMIVFTLIGGIEAIVWIEVVQLAIYVGGAIAAACVLIQHVGLEPAIAVGAAAGKFSLFDFSFDLTKTFTFWSGLIGGTFLTLSTHGTDQYMVQRYLCTDNPRSASKAVVASGIAVLVQFALFLFIGVLLFAFYGSAAPVDRIRSDLPALHRQPHAGRDSPGWSWRRFSRRRMSSSLNAIAGDDRRRSCAAARRAPRDAPLAHAHRRRRRSRRSRSAWPCSAPIAPRSTSPFPSPRSSTARSSASSSSARRNAPTRAPRSSA